MPVRASIDCVAYHLPEQEVTNQQLAAQFAQWDADQILDKTGIATRRVAGAEETSSDLAVDAAEKLFAVHGEELRGEIDYLLLCTQTPDYLLPTTACLVQDRLGLQRSIGAIDLNQGCSGYIYALSLAKGLVETGQSKRLLLVTADTYSKLLQPSDSSVRTLFGDAASATVVQAVESDKETLGPFTFGTDGRGADNLIARGSGMRPAPDQEDSHLRMSGPDIFTFAIQQVPRAVKNALAASGRTLEQIDHVVFHQANGFMLEHLRAKLKIRQEQMVLAMEHCGNTVSSSIPIALSEAQRQGKLKAGDQLLLVGFGVGYSWGVTFLTWSANHRD